MSAYMVWIEKDLAKIYDLQMEGQEPKILRQHMVLHHSGNDAEAMKDVSRLFEKVAKRLQGAGEILVVGPGLAKKSFVSYLEKHARDLAKAVVGLENADKHLSDKQLLAMSRSFFRYFDVYGKVPAGAESPRR